MFPILPFVRRGFLRSAAAKGREARSRQARRRQASSQLMTESLEPRAMLAAVNIVNSPNADMAYNIGKQIAIQVEYDGAVNISGQPLLLLNSGGFARYTGTSGAGTVLNFLYTVQAGENSVDLDVSNATASLVNGTITDVAGGAPSSRLLPVAASPSSLGFQKNISIDTTAPVVPTVSRLRVNPMVWQTNPNFFNLHPDYFTLTGKAGTAALPIGEKLTVTVNGCTYSPTVGADGTWRVDLQNDAFTGGVINPWSTTDINAYDVLAIVTDAAGNTSVDPTRNELAIDMTAPTINNVTSSNADGSYKAGDVISINVDFNEPVSVTGTPQIQLNSAANRFAVYGSTSSNVVTFLYTVIAGDSAADLDYSAAVAPLVSAINPMGGMIQDLAGNTAALALPAPGALTQGTLAFNKNIVIDTVAPVVTRVAAWSANGFYGPNQVITIDVTFDSAVVVTGNPTLDLNAGPTAKATYVPPKISPSSPQTTVRFAYTVAQGDSTSDLDYRSPVALTLAGGSIKDVAGNDATLQLPAVGTANSLASISDIKVVSSPVVTAVTSTKADGTYTAGDVISITVRFDRAVTLSAAGLAPLPTLQLNASVANSFAVYASGSGTNELVFSYTVRAGDTTPGDLDYASTSALNHGGYTFTDTVAGTATPPTTIPAILTLPATGSASPGSLDFYKNIRIAVDTTPPVATSLALGVGVADGATYAESTQASGVVTVAGEVNATITVTFTGVGGVTVVKPVIGTGSMQPVVLSAVEVIALGTGTVSVTARQADPSGNLSPLSSPISFTRAIVPPGILLGSGVANGATLAEATQPSGVVTVTGDSGNTITVVFSRGLVTVTKIVSGNGITPVAVTLTATELEGLGDGTVSVSATQRDPALMTSNAATTSFVLDTVAPATLVLALGTGVANGATKAEVTQSSGVVTVSGELNATITVTFSGPGGGTVTKTLTGTGSSQAVVLNDTDVNTLGDGSINVTASQKDAAGNQGSPATTSFMLDTGVPTAPALVLGVGVVGGATGTEATQASGIVTVTGEASAAITVVFNGLGGGAVTKILTGTGGSQPVVLTNADVATLGDGLVTVTASQADAAGNGSLSQQVQFTLDTIAPSVTNVTSSNNNGTYLPGATIKIQVQLSEAVTVAAGTTATLALNTGRNATLDSPLTNPTSVLVFSYVVQAGDVSSDLDYTGTNAMTILAGSMSDAAGNSLVSALPVPPVPGPLLLRSLVAGGSLGQNKNLVIAGQVMISSTGFGSQNPATAPNVTKAITSIPINFNMAISGFKVANLRLYLNNRLVSLKGASVTGSGAEWVVRLPALATNLKGLYRLDIIGAGIVATNGAKMNNTASIYWRRR